jgi:hypothetical protein
VLKMRPAPEKLQLFIDSVLQVTIGFVSFGMIVGVELI